MTDPAWFVLTVACSALAGGICAWLVSRLFGRNLAKREKAVTDAEDRLRRAARETAKSVNDLADGIAVHDEFVEIVTEPAPPDIDDTVFTPKVRRDG